MATIEEKNPRRFRVQFTMTRALHESYESSQERASRLNVVIDFSRDFQKWFAGQLEQVSRELQQLEEEQAKAVKPQPVTTAPVGQTLSSIRSATANSPLEGGSDHGDPRE